MTVESIKLGGMNQFQVLGSAITYLRRYSLSSILGLVTDEDTDAAGKEQSKLTNVIEPGEAFMTDDKGVRIPGQPHVRR